MQLNQQLIDNSKNKLYMVVSVLFQYFTSTIVSPYEITELRIVSFLVVFFLYLHLTEDLLSTLETYYFKNMMCFLQS